MSCTICLSDPPNNPVLTIDGSIYCLECISQWFDSGKSTSPTTGLNVLKILIPATPLCQQLNIPITKIPSRFLHQQPIQERPRNIFNITQQSNINNFEILPKCLMDQYHQLELPTTNRNRNMDVVNLYKLMKDLFNFTNTYNCENCYCKSEKFVDYSLYHASYNATIENGRMYKFDGNKPLPLPIPLRGILLTLKPKSFNMNLKPDDQNGTYPRFVQFFISQIPLILFQDLKIIMTGYSDIFKKELPTYRKNHIEKLTTFEIYGLLKLHNLPAYGERNSLFNLLLNSNIKPNVDDFIKIYEV